MLKEKISNNPNTKDMYFYMITTLFFTFLNINLFRIFIYDSKYVAPAIFFIMIMNFLIKIKFNLNKIYFSFNLVLCILFLFLGSILFLFGDYNSKTIENLYIYYYLPIISISLFYNIFRCYDFSKVIFYIFITIFIVDSIYIFVEIIDEYFDFNIHRGLVQDWYIEKNPERFEHVHTGWKPEMGKEFLYAWLPKVMGLRGFPHTTIPLYCISFFASVIFLYSNNSTKSSMIPTIFTFLGLFFILNLGVKTHIISTLLGLSIIGIFFPKKIFRDLLFAILPTGAIIYLSPYLQFKIYNMFVNLLVTIKKDGTDKFFEKGELLYIFDIKSYFGLFKIPYDKLITGFGYIPPAMNKDLSFEIMLFAKMVILGFPYILFYLCLTFYIIYILIKLISKKPQNSYKNLYLFLLCSIILIFLDTLHFGHGFTHPLYILYFIIISYCFHLKSFIK